METDINIKVNNFFKKNGLNVITKENIKKYFKNINATNRYGGLLHAPVQNKFPEDKTLKFIDTLLQCGVDVNLKGASTGYSFIHLALYGYTKNGEDYSYSTEFIINLITLAKKYHFDVNIKDNDGEIPSLGFDKDKLEKLLRKDEFSDSDRSFAERMLFSILENCYSADRTYEAMDTISALLGIIRPAARDNGSGNTPLMSIIIQEGIFPELYDQILSIGVDINAVDRNGETALQLVILSPECTAAKIRYLIDHGADPSGKSSPSEGRRPPG